MWQISGLYSSTGIIPNTSAPPLLLLDAYPNAFFAYSFRKLRNAYAGSAVRIRRDSDNAEQDVGFSGNDFDAASAAAFIGAGNGFITTWYDQSGNANDTIQTVSTAQPQYSATTINSLPGMTFDGSNDSMFESAANSYTAFGSDCTLMAAIYSTGTNETWFRWDNSANRVEVFNLADDMYWDFGDAGTGTRRVNFTQPVGWDNNDHILQWYKDSSTVQGIVVDGTSIGSAARDSVLNAGSGQFSFDGSTSFPQGKMTEMVYWATDLGVANRAGANANMNTYYAVY